MEHFDHLNDEPAVPKDPDDDAKTTCAMGVLLFSSTAPLCGLVADKGAVGLAIGLGVTAATGALVAMIAYLSIGKKK